MNITPETYYELSRHPRIVATKEANGDIAALAKTISLCGDELDVYSGNDDQITPLMSLGGKGVISVLSNICPQQTHDMVAKALEGDFSGSAELQLKFMPLISDLFCDVNPIAVKEAMVMMGWPVGRCRMPLAPLSSTARAHLQSTLRDYNLI